MRPDDPRHGTYSGYQAHVAAGETTVRCEPCLAARRRHDKRNRLRIARGIPALVDGQLALDAVHPWLQMGIAPSVLDACIGHATGGIMVRLVSGDISSVRLQSLVKLRAITEDMLPDSAYVHADLTRYRVYSLMAAGHRQRDLGVPPTGRWRTNPRLLIGLARHVRETYRRLEQQTGACATTATRARNSGYLVPAGWDDPGTLAWPQDCSRPEDAPEDADADPDYLDEAAIQRRIAGERVDLTTAERVEIVRRLLARGLSASMIEKVTGLKSERYRDQLREVA